jgi:nucleoside-diphosphate-sugar epimerase
MSKIGIIGATSFLGSYATDRLDAVSIKTRFENSLETWQEVADRYSYLSTIIILARACRETKVSGLAKIVSVFNNKRIIYTSSKSIDPYERDIYSPVSREDITKLLEVAANGHLRNKTINLPNYRSIPKLTIPNTETTDPDSVYAMTKICGEVLVKSCCRDYTIFRIWDITQ